MELHVLATAILNHAAQLTFLAALVWCAAKLFAKNRPHLAHALWILVLIKCVVPPAWSSPTSLFNLNALNFISIPTDPDQNQSHATPDNSFIANDTGNVNEVIANSSDIQFSVDVGVENETLINSESIETPWFTDPKPSTSWQPFLKVPQSAIAFGVCTLVIGFAAGLLITCARLLWFIKSAYSKGYYSDAEIDNLVCQLSKRLGVKRFVTVRLVRNPIGPVVLGLIRPTLLLPDLIVRGRKLSELEPLIAHELIHVRRGDLWWSMLQAVATSLWWFHPLVRFAGRMVSRETERSCDEETVACLSCSPAAYARSLLDVLERKHQLQIAPALPGVRPIEVTLDRMERIMNLGQGSHKRTPRWIWAAIFVGCAIALPSGSVGVAQDAKKSGSHEPAQVTGAVQKPNNDATSAAVSPWVSYRDDVGDLIDVLNEQGMSKEEAQRWIRSQLPSGTQAIKLAYGGTVNSDLGLSGQLTIADVPSPQIVDRELVVSDTQEKIDALKTKLRFLRETCRKQVACEVRVMRLRKDDLKEASANWSLTRINPNGVRIIVDGKEVAVERPSLEMRMRPLPFDYANPSSSWLNDADLDAFNAAMKRKDVRGFTAPRVTGRSGITVNMRFDLDSKADDAELFLQGTSLELTPTILEHGRVCLKVKSISPIANQEGFLDDPSIHGGLTESEYQLLTSEAPRDMTHVMCLRSNVDGEDAALLVLVKCTIVESTKGGTSATFDKSIADNSGYVNVGGEVQKPDRYELDKPTNVAQAIAVAGGIHGPAREPGSLLEVSILRQENDIPGSILSSFILDPTKLGKEATQADDLWVKAKDIVFVRPASPTITIEQSKQLSRANHKQIVNLIAVLGPTTAGLVHDIPRLEYDEVFQALHKSLNTNGRYALGSRPYSRIESEIIAKSKDEKRFVPLIGDAVLHHTFYKCTVYFKDSDERREVLIDHNHFHMD